MLQKITPFIFIAILIMVLVPQFLKSYSVSDNPQSEIDVKQTIVSTSIKPKKTAHYVSGKRQVEIKANPHGHFITKFKINGRAISGLIDTGATYVALNKSTAISVGIRPASLSFNHKIKTANGIVNAAYTTLDRMEIGSIQASDVGVFILEDRALSSTLIGMSFMSKLSSFRIENNQLILTQ